MTQFSVVTEELAAAGAAVTRSTADLGAARGAVGGSAGAAAGTPAAGAYEALVDDANRALTSLQSAVDDLSGALNRAASNYVATDGSVAACYAPGAGG